MSVNLQISRAKVDRSTIFACVVSMFEHYGSLPCLGARLDAAGAPASSFSFLTYSQVRDHCLALGRGLTQSCQVGGMGLREGELLGIRLQNSIEWYITDLTAALFPLVCTPLGTTYSTDTLVHVLAHCRITALICDAVTVHELLPRLQSGACPLLRNLIVVNTLNDCLSALPRGVAAPPCLPSATVEKLRKASVGVCSFADVQAVGMRGGGTVSEGLGMPRGRPAEALFTIIFTSGSTGVPKGVMIGAGAWNHRVNRKPLLHKFPVTWMSFMPSFHTLDRGNVWFVLAAGGKVGFPTQALAGEAEAARGLEDSGAMFAAPSSLLFDDFRALSPTLLVATARFYNSLHNDFISSRRSLLERQTGGQASRLEMTGDEKEEKQKVEAELAAHFRAMLGGKLRSIVNSGSPIGKTVLQWLRNTFQCRAIDMYGSTEGNTIFTQNRLRPGATYKLADVPHLNYFTTDKPYPRGEILVRSPDLFMGYYLDETATAGAFTADRWFKTGDVGLEKEQGHVLIIDRVKNVYKLSQGEFVAPERLEAMYSTSALCEQVFIYADSTKAFVLAVAVPAKHLKQASAKAVAAAAEAGAKNAGGLVALEQRVLADLIRIAAVAPEGERVHAWEIPRGVVLSPVPFTHANGMLTGPNKLNRNGIKTRFKPELDHLFKRLTDKVMLPPSSIADAVAKQGASSAFEQLQVIIRLTVAGADSVLDSAQMTHGSVAKVELRTLGADSLSMTRLAAGVKAFFHVDVPVSLLLKDGLTLQGLAKAVTANAARASAANRGGVAAAIEEEEEGRRAARRAGQVQVVQRLEADAVLGNGPAYKLPLAGGQHEQVALGTCGLHRCVLVTGGTGFIGKFVIWELWRQSNCTGGDGGEIRSKFECGEGGEEGGGGKHSLKIYCVVRQSGGRRDAARRRLLAELALAHPNGLRRVPQSLANSIVVMTGALDSARLGMEESTWNEVCQEADTVYHMAAQVNHVQPYSFHKEANVEGTREVLRLCFATRPKHLIFLSSVAALTKDMLTADNKYMETTPLGTRHLARLGGYAQSKWVAEKMIMQAGARGLPCTVFRTAFISGHSRTGMCNEKDMMCRLLRSMAELGTAPTVAGWPSSSEAQSTRASITEHVMDMTPVDWAARACVYASRTYNWLRSHKGEGVGARVLSLRSPNHAVTVHMLFEAVVASGYTCRPLAYETWKDQVTQTSSTPFAPLIARFPRTGDMPAHRMDITQLQMALKGCPGLPAMEVSHVALLRCLDFLIDTGVLQPPSSTSRQPFTQLHAPSRL